MAAYTAGTKTVSLLVRILACFFCIAVTYAQSTPALVSIAEINRDADGDRIPDSLGDSVSIRAVVTSNPFEVLPGPLYRLYLDDGSGGLMLQTPHVSLVDGITAGDEVFIEGQVDFYNGSAMIAPHTVDVVGAASVPPPITVTVSDLVSEKYEGRRIRVRGNLVNAQNVELVDETGAIRVRVRRVLLEDIDFKRRLYSESRAEVVGIASQYDPSSPHDAGYRIEMLSTDDLVLRVDYRPYAWVPVLVLLTGLFWWRARIATRREADARILLDKVRASERALKDSEERMRTVADATSDVIWELDLTRGELFWHAGAQELFGVDRDKPTPYRGTHLESIHEDDAERVRKSLAGAIEQGRESWTEEYRIVREDGEVRYVSDRARIFAEADGSPLRVIGALVDVTDRVHAAQRERELQDNMQHAQRLESLGILSSGIAHDFNNILAAIVGSADLLRESSSLGGAERALVEQITRSCERGVGLTGKMLTYAGRAPTERESVDINQLVEDTLAIVGNAVAKSVVLNSELDPDLPRVDGDPAQLQQVVMNFVTNAVEALAGGRGEVTVTTAFRDVQNITGQFVASEFRPGKFVMLTIRDTGSGIAPGEEAKIFEPFYTTKASGRGLGLSAVVGIINNHDACLCVDSRPGNGTTVTALFPEGKIERRDAPAAPNTLPSRSRHGKVLVADDEEVIGKLVARALEPLALASEMVHEGREALERILANRDEYDLLVLDVSMPGLDGDQIFSRVRDAGIETPVLFISGHGAYDLEHRVSGADNVAILAKPFPLDTLRERCLELLGEGT